MNNDNLLKNAKDTAGAVIALVIMLCITPMVTGLTVVAGFITYPGNMLALIWWGLKTFLRRWRIPHGGSVRGEEETPPFLGVREGFGSQYISGFIIAVPLCFAIVLLAHVTASSAIGEQFAGFIHGLAVRIFGGDFIFSGRHGYASIALVFALYIAIILWGSFYSYRSIPEVHLRKWDLSSKGLAAWILLFSLEMFYVSFCVAGPIVTMLICLKGLNVQQVGKLDAESVVTVAVKIFFVLACVPAFLLGLALFLRGFWLLRLKLQLQNLATSNVGSAAQGPVELRGRAQPLSGGPWDIPILVDSHTPIISTSIGKPFYIVGDDGSRVLVDMFRGGDSGQDSMLLIENTEGSGNGEAVERRLMPGDSIYALGELARDKGGGLRLDDMTPVLRPWVPAREGGLMRWLGGFLDRSVFLMGTDAAGSYSLGRLMQDGLGIQFIKGVFLITNASEERAKRLLFTKWSWKLGIGLFYMIGSGALLVMVMNGSILRFM